MTTNYNTISTDLLSDRQLDIVTSASSMLNAVVNDVVSVNTVDNIPESLTFQTATGNYTRNIVHLYGSLLNEEEQFLLKNQRLADVQNSLSSLNQEASKLGQQKTLVEAVSAASNRIKVASAITSAFNSAASRLANAGLTKGAQTIPTAVEPIVKFTSKNAPDTRVRITVPSSLTDALLNNSITIPLAATNGVVFPYTPTIQSSNSATYDSTNLVHTNYAYNFYQSSNTENISISGEFACKNSIDAHYVIAAQHFFRTVTKMFYGQDPEAGLPPPVLRLSGYGDYQFSSVPIVITNFTLSLPNDVDYITATPITTPGVSNIDLKSTRVPVLQTFSIECKLLYSRNSISNDFGFRNFAAGKLLGSANRGGFI